MNLGSIKNLSKIFVKGIILIFVFFYLCSLTACIQQQADGRGLTISPEIFRAQPNDNLTFLFVEEEGIYYSKSIFDSVAYYFAEETENSYKSTLLINDFFEPEKVSLSPIIQPVGSDVFFVEYNRNNGNLNKINAKTKKKEILFPQNICGSWIVSGDKIVFEQNNDNISALCYQLLADKSANIISNDMESFAVCNNRVRYIENSNSNILVFEFDMEGKKTIELGSFKIEDYERYSVSFSYGTDSIVFYQTDTDKNKEVFIYSIRNNNLKKYDLPCGINNICCAEHFAFLSSNDINGGIYRLCLDDGTVEKVCDETNACLSLYAINDNSVCAVFSKGEIFKKNSVYKISADGTMIELFQY